MKCVGLVGMLVDCSMINVAILHRYVYSTSLCVCLGLSQMHLSCVVLKWMPTDALTHIDCLLIAIILIDSFIVELFRILNRMDTHHCILPVTMVTLPLLMFFSDVEQTPT